MPFSLSSRLEDILLRAGVVFVLAALAQSVLVRPASAQDTTDAAVSQTLDRTARVFLDCDRCDTSYIRRNLNFVDYVRNREQADVHVLGTVRQSGGGGSVYRLEFIGQGEFDGIQFQLTYTASPTLTQAEERQGLLAKMRVGLVTYASRTPAVNDLSVTFSPAAGQNSNEGPQDDPWNQWVFDVGSSGSFDFQEKEYSYELEGNLSAERITEAWKLNFRADGEREVDVFEQSDTTDIRSTSENFDFDGNVVKTLGPQSGAGLSGSVYSRTFTNIQLGTRLRAAFEYNIFPYSISDQKALTFTYRIGPEYRKYFERTIYKVRSQTLVQQSLEIGLDLTRTWGSVYVSLEGSNYFHDVSKHSLELNSYLSIRLTEGLSLRLNVDAERVKDQLSLAAGDLTDEEILLRRQQRATNYAFGGSIGLSYTFGSIYNSVVNTRL